MTLARGHKVWIPCEVRRSAFPDERAVRIESSAGTWGGYLDVRQLRDEVEEGRTEIAATVVDVAPGHVSVQLPGQAERGRYLTGPEGQFSGLRRV